MNDKYEDVFSLVIKNNILFKSRQKRQIYDLFQTKEACINFFNEFFKEKNYFLYNITNYLNTNKKIEHLKYLKQERSFFCFRYRKNISKQNNKNIRCIFFIYEDNIILLDIFNENNSTAYNKAIKRAISTYKEIIEEGD